MKYLRNLFCFILLMALCAVPIFAADGLAVRNSAEFYLSFDEGIKDDRGNYTLTLHGDIPVVESGIGKAGHFAEGNYLTIENYDLGTDSFTISMWQNLITVNGDPVLIGNKDWASGHNPGMALVVMPDRWDMNLNTTTGERTDHFLWVENLGELCESTMNTWINVTYVVDRDACAITSYFNGVQVEDVVYFTVKGHDGSKFADEANGYTLNIGNDGTGTLYTRYESVKIDAYIDEVAIFRKALTAEEVSAMYNSYLETEPVTPPAETEPPETEPVTPPAETDPPETDPVTPPTQTDVDAPKTFDVFSVIAVMAALSGGAAVALRKKK